VRLRAVRLDLGHGGVERLAVAGGHDDPRPATPRLTDDRTADAARCSGDDDDLLGQRFLAHGFPVPGWVRAQNAATLGTCPAASAGKA
jgi:hypothetical protein